MLTINLVNLFSAMKFLLCSRRKCAELRLCYQLRGRDGIFVPRYWRWSRVFIHGLDRTDTCSDKENSGRHQKNGWSHSGGPFENGD